MRIAQVSPLYESVPPQYYGGTERVVHFLTEELVRQGHDVTLFASGDSVTQARLVAMCPHSLRRDPTSVDALAHHLLMLERVFRAADEFDVLHFHIDYLHFPLSRRAGRPNVTTLHGRLDIADLPPLYREFHDMPLVSISDAQREPLPEGRWLTTIHHGLPADLLTLEERPGDYLAFLGRISPEKRVDRAIEIARLAGWPIRIAAKIDAADQAYFDQEIAPLFELPFVEYIGEISETEKQAFLGGARALLFPIDWMEPFGLVMIEAMACGTPVIAWPGGSVTEVLEHGVTGFIVETIDDAVKATRAIDTLGRRQVREVFDRRFTAARMARDYVAVYETLLSDHASPPQTRRPARVA
ncbi:MAG TPA: glycosyltransferase family 4 protein [Vicinamibacterales bacterium]|nr:glycosyltransferase family 4 protein [Vicinamibacterales bacterium]